MQLFASFRWPNNVRIEFSYRLSFIYPTVISGSILLAQEMKLNLVPLSLSTLL